MNSAIKFIMSILVIFYSSLSISESDCKIVNGFNLCEDAKKIAANTRKDIGIPVKGSEYILQSSHAEGMKVISVHESVYTESQIDDLLSQKNYSKTEIAKVKGKIKSDATVRLCKFYASDVFVQDGGSFEVHYQYKNGRVFHKVLAEKNNCREI